MPGPGPGDPITARATALQDASRQQNAELPTELCLFILLHCGGLRHPVAGVFRTDPELLAWHRVYGEVPTEATHAITLACACSRKPQQPLWRPQAFGRCDAHHSRLKAHDTFRPLRSTVAHIRRITLNAEGGYRDRDDATLDKFGQAWCCCGLNCSRAELWHRLWAHVRGVSARVWNPHMREYSLVYFLRRALTSRIEQDYEGLTGTPVDGEMLSLGPAAFRLALIRGILAADV